ncbi:MAG: hypothetical protein KGZ83_17785 [Sulfuricella sp.]|nr:hypothetical protein [Sulfuricella sp.]
MAEDLTTSQRERQNILNNRYALAKAEAYLALGGIEYQGERVFTKQQVVALFEISDSTVEKYLAQHEDELKRNGYVLLRGNKLKTFKGLPDVSVINYGTKISVLGLFSFRAVLNLAMLLTESEKARAIRSRILDIVLDVVAERSGGHTKFINQRDQDYLPAAYQEFSYRQVFTDALRDCLSMGNMKYSIYTDKIYKAIFRENAQQYRQILKLADKDNPRDTMYAEVLRTIASFESGLAGHMRQFVEEQGRKLTPRELDAMITKAEASPFMKPILDDARSRMASRDLCFRDALHHALESYVQTVPEADFERFLGETSRTLEERLSDPETLAVFKRLKDR